MEFSKNNGCQPVNSTIRKNKYQDGKCKFHKDHHNLNHSKLKLETVCKTVQSTHFNGSKCQIVLPISSKDMQLRCEPCRQLLRQCVRKLPPTVVFNHKETNLTSPHSTAKLKYLDHQQLLSWCQKMAEYIKNLRKTNSRLQKHLNQEKRNVNLIQLPKNVNLTALNLTSLIELALSKQCLKKDSVLYALLCDTVTSLLKAESERVYSQSSKQSRPKGMRFHPVILKWFVELANKCGIGGYNLVREILPIPCLTTVCRMTYLDNLQVFFSRTE